MDDRKLPVVFVGDVHGCTDELRELLDMVPPGRLVFLGDLLDRGPDPLGVLRLVRELGADCVLGNHEEKHLRFRDRRVLEAAGGPRNEMRFSARQRDENTILSDDDFEWLGKLPPFLTLKIGRRTVVAMHAGITGDRTLAEQTRDAKAIRRFVRTRFLDPRTGEYLSRDESEEGESVFWADTYSGGSDVVFGHEVLSTAEPYFRQNHQGGRCFGIDTGCVFGGRLTALVMRPDGSHEFVQVSAKETYYGQLRRPYRPGFRPDDGT